MMSSSDVNDGSLENYAELFSKLGVICEKYLSHDAAPKWFLKYRVYPTMDLVEKLQFGDSTEYQDEFFDDANFSSGRNGIFYRKRTLLEGFSCVSQESLELSRRCHTYFESPISVSECENLQLFLTYSFGRRVSLVDSRFCLDEITQPELCYSVISIKIEVVSSSEFQDRLEDLFKLACNTDGMIIGLSLVDDFIRNQSTLFFPVFPKFMYLLQMSLHYLRYFEIYEGYDPMRECIDARMEIIAASVDSKCYLKDYIWTLSYQIDYFHGLMQNYPTCTDPKIPDIYKILLAHKNDVFESNTFVNQDLDIF
jgi:hypothetical protein